MGWIVVGILIVVVAAVFVLAVLKKQGVQSTDYPYRKIQAIFTPAERSFLGVLDQAVGKHAQIFGKVRVADVIAPKKGMPRGEWQKAFNKIAGKHFDFLLCDKGDLSVLCAIELNDRSHDSKKRKDRDQFLEGACQSANVPLVQFPAQATYNINAIQNALAAYVPGLVTPGSLTEPETSTEPEGIAEPGATDIEHHPSESERRCPKCSAVMVKRIAKKGKHAGNEFWACSAFPKCRYTEAVNG